MSSSGVLSSRRTWSCSSGHRGGHKNNQGAERVRVVQYRVGKAPGRSSGGLSILKRGCRTVREGYLTRANSDCRSGVGLQLKERDSV